MLIGIDGNLPVITSFLQHFILVPIIDTMRLMSFFGIIAQTCDKIPLNMFGSRFLKIYLLNILFSRFNLFRTLFMFKVDKVLV